MKLVTMYARCLGGEQSTVCSAAADLMSLRVFFTINARLMFLGNIGSQIA
jgi:hypothetical protein